MILNSTPLNKKFRRQLRITRFMNAYLPLSFMRFIIKKSANRVKLPEGVTREKIIVNGVRCEWLTPQNYSQDQILLYLHGGGFIIGLTSLHLEMIAYLVTKMKIRSLVVDYRIAPEHPFPASLEDCVNAYKWLMANGYKAENIVIAGDSAGGNLALTSVMKLRDEGEKLPVAVACLSPVGDMAKRKDAYQKRYDPVLHPRASKRYNRAYIVNNDPLNPLISPNYGSMKNFPPLLIHCGENEILKDDAIQIEHNAKESGVDVQLKIYPGMFHVWQIYHTLPQTKDSLDEVIAFLTAYLRR